MAGYNPSVCAHNILLSHATAWHLYETACRLLYISTRISQNVRVTSMEIRNLCTSVFCKIPGQISITLNADWQRAALESNEDMEVAERAQQFFLGWFAHPIYVDVDYPRVMKDQVAMKSTRQNLAKSRRPEFAEKQKVYMKGAATASFAAILSVYGSVLDVRLLLETHYFFGLNHYTTLLITHQPQPDSQISYGADQDALGSHDSAWKR